MYGQYRGRAPLGAGAGPKIQGGKAGEGLDQSRKILPRLPGAGEEDAGTVDARPGGEAGPAAAFLKAGITPSGVTSGILVGGLETIDQFVTEAEELAGQIG